MHAGTTKRGARGRRLAFAVVAACLPLAAAAPTAGTAAPHHEAVETTITATEWQAYRTRFVAADGRVIDHEKDGMSHSEGQGYGMLLAVAADDQRTFEQIASFAFDTLRARGDGLMSWLYDPAASPRIADTNNATDGDILIAYALLRAGVKWREPAYVKMAAPIIDDIGRLLITRHHGEAILRPAVFGFDAGVHADGQVLNLSYYIYGAFLLFGEVNTNYPWLELWQSGLQMTEAALTGRERLAPDWVTLRSGHRYLAPARGFAKKSSYDAVRIPLYMALGGRVPTRYLAPFDRAWNVRGNGAPLDYDLGKDRALMDMNDLGYRAIAALTGCAVRGKPIPAELQRYRNTTYFSSSLHLLALSAARQHYPHCVRGNVGGAPLFAGGQEGDYATVYAGSAHR